MKSSHPILIFDGCCVLCCASIQFILRHERHHDLYFALLHSDMSKEVLDKLGYKSENLNTIILIEDGVVYLKSKAVFRLAAYLKMPFTIFSYLRYIPAFLTDFIYDRIANNRYILFGKRNDCYFPSELERPRFIY